MKIIEMGQPYLIKRTRRFKCKQCGCIFEADKDEYEHSSQYNEGYVYCKCPCCFSYVYQEE